MRRVVWGIAGTTVLLVLAGVWISSAFPDGLERVAASLGFASRESAAGPGSPFAHYETRFLHSHWAAQVTAGLVGVLLLYGFGVLFGKLLKRK